VGPRRSTGRSTSTSTGSRPDQVRRRRNALVSAEIPTSAPTLTSNPRSRKRRTSAPVILNGGNGATSMSQRGQVRSPRAPKYFPRLPQARVNFA
jgi:hypothetical protein